MTATPYSSAHDADHPLFGAIAAGGVAAFLGGGLWAVIVMVTHFEVGWVAWGVGALVGVAMSRATPARGRHVATLGALMAGLGLLTGKLLIITLAARPGMASEILKDPDLMTRAALYDLQASASLDDGIQAQLDALTPADTVSDALWVSMQTAGADRLEGASTPERERMADQYAGMILSSIGTTGMLRAQLTAWDLLWFFLALTTAWRMLSGAEPAPAPAKPLADGARPDARRA
jgi:hypothetical protein